MFFEIIVCLGCFILVLALLGLLSPLLGPKQLNLLGSHVLITGGSSGIGKAIAIETVKRGACVTIFARKMDLLLAAKKEVEQHISDSSKQKVLIYSVDVASDFESVEKAVNQAQDKLGPVDALINSAGFSIAGRCEDLELEDIKRLMSVNYFGCVHSTRAVIKVMKERHHGRIVYVSSQAGQVGLFGFSAYSASKFALRGFAESLQMELKPYNVHITLAYPPDTDTPGFEEENKCKPRETRLISETAGLYQPDEVAKSIVNSAVNGRFTCAIGLDGWMLSNVTAGMSPTTNILEALQQIFTMGIFRAVGLIYIESFNRIVSKCKHEDDIKGKSKND
ncbi:3-ketodihydrosphingosine reductase-like isoform X1 [Tubulanus polymorphus]|uniref:3-ketodihydrosphingosine reductase-like isoform X1 n=1 Tax=Tubulanus polymorphus TaxID=672921 RepID=UPI003DA582D8